MNFRRSTRLGGALCLAAFTTFGLLGGCSDDEHPPTLINKPGTGGKKGTGGTNSETGGTDGGGAGGMVSTGGDTTGTGGLGGMGGMGGEATVPVNCGDLVCEGEGAQCVAVGGTVDCTCKEGYLREEKGEGFECVVDTSCVKVRPLETGCRVELQGAPTVALFFSVDYCAGTAVLPADLGNIDTAFAIAEDGQPLQVESKAQVIPRDVESFVTIALDVSSSVTIENPTALTQVTDGLKAFLADIERPPGKPPVTVSLLVFARDVGLMVPFTGNTATIEAALDAIKTNPKAALSPVLPSGTPGEPNLNGTTLMEAVSQGITETERMQTFRRVVTNNGVLTTGTLVVVTDGEDSNKAPVPANLGTTLVNVISLGISDEIKGTTLASIGRDGAFLAPTQESLSDAFTRIAKRVNEHPDRAYLLGYCSATTAGKHDVKITVAGKTNDMVAGCSFNADVFGNGICDTSQFASKCDGAQCGSMFACGACADDACCAGTTCAAPSGVTGDCRGIDELCEPGQVCVENLPATNPKTYQCAAPVANGEVCNTGAKCDAGLSYCNSTPTPDVCAAVTLSTGDVCQDDTGKGFPGAQCPEGNCSRENSSQTFHCEEQARLGDECSGSNASARCERGTICSSTCKGRYSTGMFACSKHDDCASGYCDPVMKLCTNIDGKCHFSWDEKLE